MRTDHEGMTFYTTNHWQNEGTRERATENMIRFVAQLADHLDASYETVEDDPVDGRYPFILYTRKRAHTVDMPGVELGPGTPTDGNPLIEPRLLIDYSSWYWRYAIDIVTGEDEEDVDATEPVCAQPQPPRRVLTDFDVQPAQIFAGVVGHPAFDAVRATDMDLFRRVLLISGDTIVTEVRMTALHYAPHITSYLQRVCSVLHALETLRRPPVWTDRTRENDHATKTP